MITKKQRLFSGLMAFLSIISIGCSSCKAAYKTYTEELVMDNDAKSTDKFRNPTSTNGRWAYYPKESWGMQIINGTSHYRGSARKGLCTIPAYGPECMIGGTVYAWEWMGKDNTVPGSVVSLYVKINDVSFNAPDVEYIHRDTTPYTGGESFGRMNQNTWPGSLSCLSTIRLSNPGMGPYVIASGVSSNNAGCNMGADQIKYVHTYKKYISTK